MYFFVVYTKQADQMNWTTSADTTVRFFLKPHDVLTINATSATSGRRLSLLHFLPFFHKLKLPTLSVFSFAVT